MLALSKAKVTAYNARVLVRATCELDGELFSKCTVEFSGAVFKSELQPIKGDPTALEKRATELAEPKFIAQIKKKMAKRKLAALAVESTPPAKRRTHKAPEHTGVGSFKPTPSQTPSGSRQGGTCEDSAVSGLRVKEPSADKMVDFEQENEQLKKQVCCSFLFLWPCALLICSACRCTRCSRNRSSDSPHFVLWRPLSCPRKRKGLMHFSHCEGSR